MRGEGIVPVMEVGNNNGNGAFGGYANGDWAWIIILFLIFGNGRGFGNGFGGGSYGGVADNYVLATDFATIERKLDSISNGICDSTFALNNTITNGNFGIQNSLTQGFAGLNTALLQGNYALSSQLSDGFCGIGRSLDGINYNNAINTNTLSRQISDCCCNIEKMNMQNRYDAQTYNCNTLQAIDKLGDRIIDRLTQDKVETLTAENQALRLRASQEAQNAYLINELKPCPSPSYIVPNPNCCYQYNVTPVNNCNSCGCY